MLDSYSSLFEILSTKVKGPLFFPNDEGFEAEISPFNTAVKHTPNVVVGATSNHDILEAMSYAKQNVCPITVQSTGHGALEPVTSGILITTHRMNQIHIDPQECTATISAGVKCKDLISAAAPYGLAFVAGSSVDVGVIGYLLGGGVGPLARSHGFSSDYLLGMTVVTHSCELLEISNDRHSDLFWALRGGKTGLGIVTEVKLKLVELNKLYAGSLIYEEKDIETVLRAWGDWTIKANENVTTSIAIVNYPDILPIPEKLRGRRLISLRFAYPGSIEEGEKLAAPLRNIAPVYVDGLGELPSSEMGRIHNDPSHPMPFWASSVLVYNLDQDFITYVLEEFGTQRVTPFTALEIRHIGGATHKDVPEGSAVGGRSAKYVLSLVGKNPHQFQIAFQEKRDLLFNNLQPWISEEGNINLMGKSIQGQHYKSMWPEKMTSRLHEIQKKYASE